MSLKEAMERALRRAQAGPAIEEPQMDIGEAMRIVMRRHATRCEEERCPLKGWPSPETERTTPLHSQEATMTTSMEAIERLTKSLADARSMRAERVQALRDEIEGAIRRRVRGLKSAIAQEAAAEEALRTEIEGNPGLFDKPRTQVFHGIKVGLQKGKGGISWEDDSQVVRLIRKHLPDQFDLLVKVEETPIRSALNNLSVEELRQIGCHTTTAGDQVLVKATDTTADKLLKALRKGIKLDDVED